MNHLDLRDPVRRSRNSDFGVVDQALGKIRDRDRMAPDFHVFVRQELMQIGLHASLGQVQIEVGQIGWAGVGRGENSRPTARPRRRTEREIS